MTLFARDMTFFDLLERQAEAVSRSAQAFQALTEDFDNAGKHAQALKQIEHEADELVQELSRRIDASFVTPLDKEDLHALGSRLDDVIDAIEAAASRLSMYGLEALRPDIKTLVGALVQISPPINEAVAGLRHLRHREKTRAALAQIHGIESEGDYIFRHALAELFGAPAPDPLTVIKWKDVYERVEKAIDLCEQVAKVIEGILIKYA